MQINKINNNQPMSFNGAIRIPCKGNKVEMVSAFEHIFKPLAEATKMDKDSMSFLFHKPEIEKSARGFLENTLMKFVHLCDPKKPEMSLEEFEGFHKANLFG